MNHTTNTYAFSVLAGNGATQELSDYQWKVAVIVNVASQCGLTPQYEELETLYETYRDKGFVILGFPCNQFAGQEPWSYDEIVQGCKINYGVTFPIMAKVEVNGDNADPLFVHLKKAKRWLFSRSIKWNFTKFLIDRNGNIIKRYAPTTVPRKMEADIKKLLRR